jgi:hypothetical protein
VAIFPKFDQFVQDELQRLMEAEADKMNRSGQEIGEIDEDALEEEAKIIATEKFNKDYKDVLLSMNHPPRAVVAVSGSKHSLQRISDTIHSVLLVHHVTTPKDTQLTELIRVTTTSLRGRERLFAAAQMADNETKLSYSFEFVHIFSLVYWYIIILTC